MNDTTGYDSCHCLALRKSSRHITRLYDTHLAPAGVTISQFSILSVIGNNPDIRLAELCAIMVIDRTTLVRNIKPLMQEGWVESAKADEGRAHLFRLTSQGRNRLEAAAPLWLEAQSAFENKFGSERAMKLRQDNLAVSAIESLQL